MREIIKTLCKYKGVEIIERTYDAGSCTSFAQHTAKMSIKYKFGNRHFWAEGYYVSTVGLNESTIKKYIQDQEKADIALDKLSVREYADPFSEPL